MTRLSGRLPETAMHNLDTIDRLLVDNRHARHLVVGVLQPTSYRVDVEDDDSLTATARFAAVFVVAPADLEQAKATLIRARQNADGDGLFEMDEALGDLRALLSDVPGGEA